MRNAECGMQNGCIQRAAAWLAIAQLAWPIVGCKEQSRPAVTQPAGPETSPPPVMRPPPEAASTPPPKPSKPVTPEWALIRQAQTANAPTRVAAEWTGGRRLEIKTENVSLLTLDLNKLPEGAPTRGPWTLHIDGQGIEIYGRAGGRSWRVMDLARSRNGNWEVVDGSQRDKP